MKRNRIWFGIVGLIILMARPGAQAAEIKGKIVSVSGGTAAVAIEGGQAPNVGDKAEIYFSLAGTEVSVATARVTKIDPDAIQLKIENASGDVAKDQLVRITSADPQNRAVASTSTPAPSAPSAPSAPVPPVESKAGQDPGFAFVDLNKIFQDYPKSKSGEIRINEAKATAKAEYDQRAAAYRAALDEVNALNQKLDSPKLSAAEKMPLAADRDNKIAALKKMESEINNFRVDREGKLQEQALKMREELVSEIIGAINRLAGEKVELLFDRSGSSLNGLPVVLFSPAAGEMSQRVTAALQGQSATAFEPARGLMIGLVDANRVFKYYSKTKDGEAKINAAREAARKDYDRRADAYKVLLEKINKLNSQLDLTKNEAAKARLARDRETAIAQIKNMEREINLFRETRESQLQADATKMRDGIVADITAALSRQFLGEQAALVLDTSGNGVNGAAFVLWASGLPDLSDEIISALNKTSARFGSTPISLVSSAALKFGSIDMDRAFKALPEGRQVETEINQLKERAKTEMAGADSAARTKKEKEIQDIVATKRADVVRKLMDSIRQVVLHEDLHFVFDSSGRSLNGVPFIVSTHNLPDLTDKVIAQATGSAR